MKRYEVIKVRFALDVPKEDITAILKSLVTAGFGVEHYSVYQMKDVPRDMAWVISCREGTSPGTRLASILSEYGLVDHTIWSRIDTWT